MYEFILLYLCVFVHVLPSPDARGRSRWLPRSHALTLGVREGIPRLAERIIMKCALAFLLTTSLAAAANVQLSTTLHTSRPCVPEVTHAPCRSRMLF